MDREPGETFGVFAAALTTPNRLSGVSVQCPIKPNAETKICWFVLLFSFGYPQFSSGQIPSAWDMPEDRPNNRFFSDLFVHRRPALTFNGFSCAQTLNCDHGYGVLEAIEMLIGAKVLARNRTILTQVVEWAGRELINAPTDRNSLIANTRVLQARMTVALLWLVLEGNGYTPTQLLGTGPETASAALALAFAALDDITVFTFDKSVSDDAVKWAAPLTNLARSLDLYLALENARLHYPSHRFSDPLPLLPTCQEKHRFLSLVADQIERVDDLGNEPVFLGIKRDEIQPGNWPMKVHVSVAYGSLAMQGVDPSSCDLLPEYSYEHWLYRGLRSAGAPTDQNRSKHWNYQTSSGGRLFAEGPYYFHLTLSEVIPFLHAMRINGLLDSHPDFNLDDPFHAPWFISPLQWLADTAAPGGTILPFDDGNRVFMDHADLLRWSASYGEAETGLKFAWIADQKPDSSSNNENLLTHFLAVPIVPPGGGVEPNPAVGAIRAHGERTSEQVLISRMSTRDSMGYRHDHFLALNGEYGNAIKRGEGHEQADQLQLVYYVGDAGILIDSGYDDAEGVANSTWNHYFDHNVLTVADGVYTLDGGLAAPMPSLFKTRIVSDHTEVDELGLTEVGNIRVLRGTVELRVPDGRNSKPAARYRRTSLFVGDPEEAYVIDVNWGESIDTPLIYRMSYHLGSNSVTQTGITYIFNSESGAALELETHVSVAEVGRDMRVSLHADKAMERFRREEEIVRLDIFQEGPEERFTSIVMVSAGSPGREILAPSLLQPVQGVNDPAGRSNHSVEQKHDIDAFSKRVGPGLVDVLLVASEAFDQEPILFELEGSGVLLRLTSDETIGFVRLRKRATGRWISVPGFRLNVQPVVPTGYFGNENDAVEQPELTVLPNPIADVGEIQFELEKPEQIQLSVFDIQGRVVLRLADGLQNAGVNREQLDATQLASGIYILRLSGEYFQRSIPIVVRK